MKEYADTAAKAKPHSFQVGDTVLVRQKHVNKLSSPYNKHPYAIVKIKGSMITYGKKRNQLHNKKQLAVQENHYHHTSTRSCSRPF
ncbi:Hypothetical predicted protein [Paramuricea clavata]|uniref:Uncharacterized protein n=1 Tax=Paramuricea clavata TaxID=317549 RepID=A0A7D9LZR3_PARCT|nr:Hypothetical predicted protein [Paramuricea clavata]